MTGSKVFSGGRSKQGGTLGCGSESVITYIITETRENYEKSGGHSVKLKLEKLSGLPCLVQYFADVTLERILFMGVRAVVFSGFGTDLSKHRPDFELLASTKDVPVQAYHHRTKTLYGTQFHPETYTEKYGAGKKVVENFFRLAGILA